MSGRRSLGLAEMLTPATKLTRFRNSLLASVGAPSDFQWRPDEAPKSFQQETLQPPAAITNWAQKAAQQPGSLPRIVAIVSHLRSKPKRKGPIRSTTIEAYRQNRRVRARLLRRLHSSLQRVGARRGFAGSRMGHVIRRIWRGWARLQRGI